METFQGLLVISSDAFVVFSVWMRSVPVLGGTWGQLELSIPQKELFESIQCGGDVPTVQLCLWSLLWAKPLLVSIVSGSCWETKGILARQSRAFVLTNAMLFFFKKKFIFPVQKGI